MQAGLHPSTSSAVRSILRADGPAGLYAGVLSTVARDVPFSAVQFALYELMKRRLARAQQRELLWWENAGLGAIAGGTAAAATTPLDVIKTRMMTQVRPPPPPAAAACAHTPLPVPADWHCGCAAVHRLEPRPAHDRARGGAGRAPRWAAAARCVDQRRGRRLHWVFRGDEAVGVVSD